MNEIGVVMVRKSSVMTRFREPDWCRQIVEESEKRGESRGRQIGLREGLLSAIELGLEFKFGEEGLALMPEIRAIDDAEMLQRLRDGLKTVESPQAFRRVYRNE